MCASYTPSGETSSFKAQLLQVFPRTLSLLAQTLLLRSKAGSSLYTPKHTNTYIVIWEQVMGSLTARILEPDQVGEDLNVEHSQLMLFLFHALALMQKKQVLLCSANSLIKVSQSVTASKFCFIFFLSKTILTKNSFSLR